MGDRRLVGIDLGITSAHTARMLAGDGSVVCRRKAVPPGGGSRRVEVDRQHLVEVVGGHLFEPLSAAKPGVGDEHVDPYQSGLDRVDELGGCLGPAQIGADRDRPTAAETTLAATFAAGAALAP